MKGDDDMAKKNKKPFIPFDDTKTYLFGMRKLNTPLTYPEDMVKVKIENLPKQYSVRIYAEEPGYTDKYMFDLYLDWLIDTKKFVEVV